MLELQNLSVTLGGKAIFKQLNLQVADGERLVIAGPSGSGKSTLLRAIAGLAEADAGRVRVNGQDVSQLPPAQRDVGMMFQSYALFPHLTVLENLTFGLAARGMGKAEARQRAEAAAASLGIGKLLTQVPRLLSGGERQRVALARVLLKAPKVLLLDEPLSNLDAQLRARARAEILKAHAQMGAALLMVTHDQAEAMAMAHRIGVLHEGELVQLAPPREVYARPANLFVARFFGTPEMNILPVWVALDGSLCWQQKQLCSAAELAQLLPAEQRAPGREWLLGLRAEQLLLPGPEGITVNRFEAEVQLVEHLGEQQIVWLEAFGLRLAARVSGNRAIATGCSLPVDLALQNACWFHPQTGEAL